MNIEIVKAIRIFTADGRKVLVDDESAVAAVEGMINKYDTAPNNQTAALVRPKRTRTAKTREVAPKILPPPSQLPSRSAAVVRRKFKTRPPVQPLPKFANSPRKPACARELQRSER